MRLIHLNARFRKRAYAAKAWRYGTRAQAVPEAESRAELLTLSSMWLSLTEPMGLPLQGAYEWPRPETREVVENSQRSS